jgi:hypothetical protein
MALWAKAPSAVIAKQPKADVANFSFRGKLP